MICFTCPACSRIFRTADENAGKIILCNVCKQPLQIPPAIRTAMPSDPVPANAGLAPLATMPRTTPLREKSAADAFQSIRETPASMPTPAEPKGHAVFLAILFFAAFEVLLTGGACIVVSIDDSKGKPSAGTAAGPENTDESKADDEAEEAKQFQAVLKHPFWRVEATEKDINRVIDVILAQKPGAVIFIDDQLYTSPRSGGVFEEMHKKGIILAPNDMKSDRYFYIDLEDKMAQPTRRAIISKLRTELDAANQKADP
jgi:hypothetical protein